MILCFLVSAVSPNQIIRHAKANIIAIVSRTCETNARFLSAHPSSSLSPLALENRKERKKEIFIFAWLNLKLLFCLLNMCFACSECSSRCIPCATNDLGIESKICFSNKRSVEPASEDAAYVQCELSSEQKWFSYPCTMHTAYICYPLDIGRTGWKTFLPGFFLTLRF